MAREVFAETFPDNNAYCVVRADEAEADDCIAVCCDQLTTERPDATVHVVTGDSDLYQLESHDRVLVWDRKGARWRDRLKGVDPKQYIEAKCYAGDSADGIPSVGSRIGLKTALGLVAGTKPWLKDPSRIDRGRLELNRTLILFSHIPDTIRERIQRSLS